MGFGSYDESDQQEQTIHTEREDVVDRDADHDGQVTYDSEAKSTEELIEGLQQMKDDSEDTPE